MQPKFPIEFIVKGVPVSLQSKGTSKKRWKKLVSEAAHLACGEGSKTFSGPVAVTLWYFPSGVMEGDIDNIAKPILDAMCKSAYEDDRQVARLTLQKFEEDNLFEFRNPSEVLTKAIDTRPPVVYIRISSDPFEDLQ